MKKLTLYPGSKNHANQEKGGWGGQWKAHPKIKLPGLISPAQNSKQLVQSSF